MELNIKKNKTDIIKIAKALGSERRIKILEILKENEMDISRLAEKINCTEANASAQIKILTKAGLVGCRYEPGDHGVRKICYAKTDQLKIYFE